MRGLTWMREKRKLAFKISFYLPIHLSIYLFVCLSLCLQNGGTLDLRPVFQKNKETEDYTGA